MRIDNKNMWESIKKARDKYLEQFSDITVIITDNDVEITRIAVSREDLLK